jgi:hypothetical protein
VTAFTIGQQYRGRSVPHANIDRLRRLAWLVDAIGRVPGTRFRFGLNSVIGLAPGPGDALLTLISLYIVFEAVRLGLRQFCFPALCVRDELGERSSTSMKLKARSRSESVRAVTAARLPNT